MKINKLTIIIPVFNEENTILKTIKCVLKTKIPNINKELIVVDDGSTDSTKTKILDANDKRVVTIFKKVNEGKGAAIRDALRIAKGDVIVIQDADLEYDSNEISKLLDPIRNNLADVVYGSRFMGGEAHRVHLYWHMLGNKFLTLLTNMVTNINFTDMETCYKMFTKKIANNLVLNENRFGFEPEFTIKVAQMKVRIFEIGISYSGRNYTEGKKIGWKDGIRAVWCILKYGIFR